MKKNAAPILVVALLLLPLLYVGSYFALVLPRGRVTSHQTGKLTLPQIMHYRIAPTPAAFVFWPLEQVDRKLRPRAWNDWTGMQLDVY